MKNYKFFVGRPGGGARALRSRLFPLGLIIYQLLMPRRTKPSLIPGGGRNPGRGGGPQAAVILETGGQRGVPEGTSQPDDPGGVGGYKKHKHIENMNKYKDIKI